MDSTIKSRLMDAGMIALATTPLWLTAAFAIANPHDTVLIDLESNVLSRLTTSEDCRERGGCFSFDKAGRIEQSVGVGDGWIYRFNEQARPIITHYVAAPKMGMVVMIPQVNPTQQQLEHARILHKAACSAAKISHLSGYDALNCR